MIDIDLTPLLEAVIALAMTLGVPLLLAQLNKWTGVKMRAHDQAALTQLLQRAIGRATQGIAGEDGKITHSMKKGIIAEALKYAIELSPDLVNRVTGKDPDKLAKRIEAEVAAATS